MNDAELDRGPFRAQTDHAGAPSDPGAKPGLTRRRLLIVEDDPGTCQVLSRRFLREGFDVFWAPTVKGGLALLHAGPDSVILDLNLPDGDGADVLAAIRGSELPVRVIVASATTDVEHLARVARLRPELVLKKPVDLDAMIRALGELA